MLVLNARTSKSLALAKCVWSKVYGGLRALLENWKSGGGGELELWFLGWWTRIRRWVSHEFDDARLGVSYKTSEK